MPWCRMGTESIARERSCRTSGVWIDREMSTTIGRETKTNETVIINETDLVCCSPLGCANETIGFTWSAQCSQDVGILSSSTINGQYRYEMIHDDCLDKICITKCLDKSSLWRLLKISRVCCVCEKPMRVSDLGIDLSNEHFEQLGAVVKVEGDGGEWSDPSYLR